MTKQSKKDELQEYQELASELAPALLPAKEKVSTYGTTDPELNRLLDEVEAALEEVAWFFEQKGVDLETS